MKTNKKLEESLLESLNEMKRVHETRISISSGHPISKEELNVVIESIKNIKNILIRAQDYESGAKIREIEKKFSNLIDSHPEQCLNEKFLSNLSEEEVKNFLNYKLPEHILSARIGSVAYDEKGVKIEGYRPVFIIEQ